jgi:hypothetical protein
MQLDETSFLQKLNNRALLVASIFLGCAAAFGEELSKPYDGRCESPMPPEAIAFLLDEVIVEHPNNIKLTLVRHPRPSTQAADARTAWVCLVAEKPLWVIANELRCSDSKSSGLTARALQRAREFVAEYEAFSGESAGKLKPRDWRPEKETLLPAYQAKHFDCQITEIRLVDRETESWEVTVAPIKESIGGEIWLRFRKGHAVSAEFGR